MSELNKSHLLLKNVRILSFFAMTFLIVNCGDRNGIEVETSGIAPDQLKDSGDATASTPEIKKDENSVDVKQKNSAIQADQTPALSITQSYVSSVVADVKSSYNLKDARVASEYTLEFERTKQSFEKNFQQIKRTPVLDEYTQGKDGELKKMSFKYNRDMNSKVTLDFEPDLDSVQIRVDDDNYNDFTVAGSVVTFLDEPGRRDDVDIFYTTGAKAKFKEVTLSLQPAAGTLLVKINNVELGADKYLYGKDTGKLVFLEQPVDSAMISISYLKDEKLLDTFNIDKTAILASISVTVNGAAATYNFDAGSGDLTLNQIPADDAMIVIKYDLIIVGDPIIAFTVAEPAGGFQELVAFDSSTKEALIVEYKDGQIKFDASDFMDGRKTTVQYLDALVLEGLYGLSFVPLADSLKASSAMKNANVTECSGVEYDEAKKSITIKSCKLASAETLEITYKHETLVQSEFTVDGITDPDAAAWAVFVNDVKSSSYRREGSKIIFEEKLAPASIVRIEAVM